VNEVELARLADEVERVCTTERKTFYLPALGTTTSRERDLVEVELRRRGYDVTVTEGAVADLDVKMERLTDPP
jgi:hypothetical protein